MAVRMRCELVGWGTFYTLSRRLALSILEAGFEPEVIVAVGRGGLMPGRILSDMLDQMNLTSFRLEHYRGAHKSRRAVVRVPLAADLSGRRVLLVDDVSDSGDTFRVALEHLAQHGPPAEVRTAVLHHKTSSAYVPHFFARKVVRWRWIIYPWAVHEDLGTFFAAMDPPPRDAADAARRLERDYGLRLSTRRVVEVLQVIRQRG